MSPLGKRAHSCLPLPTPRGMAQPMASLVDKGNSLLYINTPHVEPSQQYFGFLKGIVPNWDKIKIIEEG